MLPEFSRDEPFGARLANPATIGLSSQPFQAPVAGPILSDYFPHTPLTHLLVVVRRNVGTLPVNTGCTVAGWAAIGC